METPLTTTDAINQIGLIILFVIIVTIFYFFKTKNGKSYKKYTLIKAETNPILSPRSHLLWEKEGTFNPAAILLDEKIHLLYRAVGGDGISRIGYAVSNDGINFGRNEPYPIFSIENFRNLKKEKMIYSPIMYPSGGSFGGCEDPRLTNIDGVVHMTFNAFDGWNFIRVGLTMIDEKDFVNKKWAKWSKPTLISPPNEIHKNWVLFPEKINNRFAVLHSISPKIEIEYRNDLKTIGVSEPFINSRIAGQRYEDKKTWESRVRGAGPPPLKTDKGWILLYHANQDIEPHKYKLGIKLLDLQDPTKILASGIFPILEPDTWYENDWKPGIIYACGAIIKKDNNRDSLYVYYGGGDKHVCVAYTDLETLLSWLIKNEKTKN